MTLVKLDDFVGNANTISILRRLLVNGTFPQFTVMNGNFGTGKSSCAHVVSMSLTCDSTVNGSPCGVCSTCKSNLKAFETTGESLVVKVINLGTFLNKEDVIELIKNVFVLRAGSKPAVYILEEAHVLKGLYGAQTALLEEIDRMQKNTYVIMCTTRLYDLLPELTSRAMVFDFRLLNDSEARTLIYRVAGTSVPESIQDLVVRCSGGIPRKLLKSIEFIRDNSITEDEYREWVSEVSDDVLTLLIQSMRDKNVFTYKSVVDNLMAMRSPDAVLYALKDFLVRAAYCIEGATTSLSQQNAAVIRESIPITSLPKVLALFDRFSGSITASDLEMSLFRCRLLLLDRSVASVISDVAKSASVENERGKQEVIAREKYGGGAMDGPLLKPLAARVHSFE